MKSLFIRLFKGLFLLWILSGSYSTAFGQNIRGTVKDADTQITLPGAVVVIINSDPQAGTVSNGEGNFSLEGLKPGRYSLKVTYLGYQPSVIAEVLVESGKQTVLQIEMKELPVALSEVTIKAGSNKEHAINPMSMISSRQLNMEEASRYAGGIDDPARLATAFAGVTGSLSSNAIVIRGNAPKGLLWRMEGVEIPNPSHFANLSTFGGGGITALSSQMLGNSDFYTGAFPSEFGNALSGVFDMRIRTGNHEKRESTIKAGIIGLDFATEGPFKKGRNPSYLINYRYSTLALISPLLPENAQGLVYQDLSFKMNFPMGNRSSLSAWGLLSADHTGSLAKNDSTRWEYYQDREQDRNINSMEAAGLNFKSIISEKTYTNVALAATGNSISWKRERLVNGRLEPYDKIVQKDAKYTLSFLLNHKFNSMHTNRTGFNVNMQSYHIDLQHTETGSPAQTYISDDGSGSLLQMYSQSRLRIAKRYTVNVGLHSQYLEVNREVTLEPRLSVKADINHRQALTLAYGLHSRREPLNIYLTTVSSGPGSVSNKNLKLTKAHHLIVSYEYKTGPWSRLLIEPYYQLLFDVPVIPDSSFSMLNMEIDWFFNYLLINSGTGRNMGIDLTLERFLNQGYYYLLTGSLFDAVYKGDDGITRNTRFNKNYVVNILFGKEWNTNKDNPVVYGVSGKFTILGGDRISPVNTTESALVRDVVYDENRAFTDRKPVVYYLDLSAFRKKNRKNYSTTWSVQFNNLLFQKEFYGHRFNLKTSKVEPLQEIVVIPNISYRIDF